MPSLLSEHPSPAVLGFSSLCFLSVFVFVSCPSCYQHCSPGLYPGLLKPPPPSGLLLKTLLRYSAVSEL